MLSHLHLVVHSQKKKIMYTCWNAEKMDLRCANRFRDVRYTIAFLAPLIHVLKTWFFNGSLIFFCLLVGGNATAGFAGALRRAYPGAGTRRACSDLQARPAGWWSRIGRRWETPIEPWPPLASASQQRARRARVRRTWLRCSLASSLPNAVRRARGCISAVRPLSPPAQPILNIIIAPRGWRAGIPCGEPGDRRRAPAWHAHRFVWARIQPI
jgi:hypothetical protein